MAKIIVLIVVVTVWLLPVTAFAENDWLQKSTDFIKSLAGSEQPESSDLASSITPGEVEKAFKEALRVGSGNVVNQLSVVNGFYADPSIRIPLPEKLKPVKDALSKMGMEKDVRKFEKKLNRAAEAAVPKAKALFVQAINDMTFRDVMKIYDGPKDSATLYFREKMSPSLRNEMRPIVEDSLSEVGAIRAFRKLMKNYNRLPYTPEVKEDVTAYVVQKGMDGVFYYLAREEAAIRENPEKRTTELLMKVFGDN